TIRALTGNLGNVTTSGPVSLTSFEAALGTIGNLTVAIAGKTDFLTAIGSTSLLAKSIGNISATVTGNAAVTSATAIYNSFVHATAGGIGKVTGSVAGAKITDGRAI